MYLFVKLLRSDVSSAEGQDRVFTENSAGNSVPISLSELVLSQIGAYNGGLFAIEARIYHVIEARGCKLIIYLCSEVVDNKKVALDISVNVAVNTAHAGVSKSVIFKVGNHALRTDIIHVVAALYYLACNRT